MKLIFTLLLASVLGFVFASPAPQQIVIELGQAFGLTGLDSATFEDMSFRLESISVGGDNAQVMLAMTVGDSDEAEMLMLELPMAASVEVGEYTLTLLSADVPEDPTMSCAVSRAQLVLEKTEADL